MVVIALGVLLGCGIWTVPEDDEIVDYYLNKIEETANYKMPLIQREEIHRFLKENLLCDEKFTNKKENTLRDILKDRGVKFVTYPGNMSVSNSSEYHLSKFGQIKREFIEKSQFEVFPDTEWAFILHSWEDAFSDGVCEWWNLVPTPPIKLRNKTAFIYYDCLRNPSPLWKRIHRLSHKYLNWLVTAINDFSVAFHTI
ncbi:hypothetical protein FACS189472_07720 [Alphaproteobacteria bacterium]|nr:hypothetical protein FACS189472_07720 [Alphaproteobacteria bacterium]